MESRFPQNSNAPMSGPAQKCEKCYFKQNYRYIDAVNYFNNGLYLLFQLRGKSRFPSKKVL